MKFRVTVLRGTQLMKAAFAQICDPYVRVIIGSQRLMTTCKTATTEPVWNESLVFDVRQADRQISIECFDKDRVKITREVPLGTAQLDLNAILDELEVDKTREFETHATMGMSGMRSPGVAFYTSPQQTRGVGAASPAMTRDISGAPGKIVNRTVRMLYGSIELAFSLGTTPVPVPAMASAAPAQATGMQAGAAPSPARPAAATPAPAAAKPAAPARPSIAPPPVLQEAPFAYNSKFRREFQMMDRVGAVNLGRFQPPPNQDIGRVLLICCMPYEGLPHTLGKGPINDCIQMATYFRSRAYNVYYMVDVSPLQFIAWFHRFLHWGKDEFTFYFSGHGSQVKDEDGDEEDGMDEVLVFYDENKRRDAIVKASPQRGITDWSVSDDVLFETLKEEKDDPNMRCLMITDCCHSGSMFEMPAGAKPTKKSSDLPQHVVCLSASADNQTAKQTVMPDGEERGVFTHNMIQFLQANPAASFEQMADTIGKKVKKFQNIVLSASDPAMTRSPVIPSEETVPPTILDPPYVPLRLVGPSGAPVAPAAVVASPARPPPGVPVMAGSPARPPAPAAPAAPAIRPAQNHPYASKYRKEYQDMDRAGMINVGVVNVPESADLRYCMFITCMPYEGLPHTLNKGPINDCLQLGKFYISRGYTVFYTIDATPTQYLQWYTFFLRHVQTELILYFSGHGTQLPDAEGDEADGYDEVLVLYDATRRRQAVVPRHGVTEQLITDDVLLDTIEKEKRQDLRLVLITDCCHSGSMFDLSGGKKDCSGLQKTPPPSNVLSISAAADNETAKQTVMPDGVERGVFTNSFVTYMTANHDATWENLNNFLKKKVKQFSSVQMSYTNEEMIKADVICPEDKRM